MASPLQAVIDVGVLGLPQRGIDLLDGIRIRLLRDRIQEGDLVTDATPLF